MLRCAVLEADRRAMKEFDLFPSGDQSAQLICVVTASEQTIEVPYVTYSFLRYSTKPGEKESLTCTRISLTCLWYVPCQRR